MADLRRFHKLARLVQYLCYRRKGPPSEIKGEYAMLGFSQFARHALAVVGAMFISGMLMVNSLAVSAHEVHSVAGILA